MKDKIKLNILGISYSQTQSGAYTLIMSEDNGKRRLPIIIGGAEAQSIAIKLEGLKSARPLTHDLFIDIATNFDISLQEVNIYKLEEGIFFSNIILKNNNDTKTIDSRTSDAVALALRFGAPIYTSDEILKKAGVVMPIEVDKKTSTKIEESDIDDNDDNNPYEDLTLEELSSKLQSAIEDENYELAAKITKLIEEKK